MIKKTLNPFINTGITLVLLAWLLPNVTVTDWTTIVFAAIVFTLINRLVKPIIKLLTLPINFITLGLFSVAINIGMLMLALWLVPGFVVAPLTIMGVTLGQLATLAVMSVLLALTQSLVAVFI